MRWRTNWRIFKKRSMLLIQISKGSVCFRCIVYIHKWSKYLFIVLSFQIEPNWGWFIRNFSKCKRGLYKYHLWGIELLSYAILHYYIQFIYYFIILLFQIGEYAKKISECQRRVRDLHLNQTNKVLKFLICHSHDICFFLVFHGFGLVYSFFLP